MSNFSINNGENSKIASLLKFAPPKTIQPEEKTVTLPKLKVNDSFQISSLSQPTKANTNLSFVAEKPLTAIDSREVFHNSSFVTAGDLEKIFKKYGSPHQGKGQAMLDLCQKYEINPVMMLAIMQKESSMGNRRNNPHLNDENIANPWSVHFSEGAKGIKKLRLKDGSLPTFEQSLEGAIKTMLNLSGDSDTPLSQAGKKYSVSSTWTPTVKSMYTNMVKNILGKTG